MTTATLPRRGEVLDIARSQLGKHESPYGSNRQKYSTYWHHPPEPWCFTAGTLITTPDGLTPIEDLAVGDVVLSATGRASRVSAANRRTAPVFDIRALGLDRTTASGEHPYLTRRRVQPRRRHAEWADEPQWVPVAELGKHDLIALPTLDEGSEPFDEHAAYVLGRYLADGWSTVKPMRVSRRPRVYRYICGAHDEAATIAKALDLAGLGYVQREYRTVTQFDLRDDAGPLLHDAGHGARSKRLPGRCLSWNRAAREAVLRGYLDGDGSEKNGLIRADTVSRELAHGIAALARSLGHIPLLYASERATEGWIEGRLVHQASVRYVIHIRPDAPSIQAQRSPGYVWVPVRSVRPAGEATVYNLTVEDEHTFIADGAAVHNCADFACFVLDKAGALDVPMSAYTPTLAQNYKDRGRWGTKPLVGALVFFDFIGRISHVGIVEAVLADGRIVTLEGNTDEAGGRTGGKVMRHVRDARASYVVGYGYPKYAEPEADYPTLRRGDKGNAVKYLQKLLNDYRFDLKPDGQFGVKTESAVNAVKRKAGFEPNGVAGWRTWHWLRHNTKPKR